MPYWCRRNIASARLFGRFWCNQRVYCFDHRGEPGGGATSGAVRRTAGGGGGAGRGRRDLREQPIDHRQQLPGVGATRVRAGTGTGADPVAGTAIHARAGGGQDSPGRDVRRARGTRGRGRDVGTGIGNHGETGHGGTASADDGAGQSVTRFFFRSADGPPAPSSTRARRGWRLRAGRRGIREELGKESVEKVRNTRRAFRQFGREWTIDEIPTARHSMSDIPETTRPKRSAAALTHTAQGGPRCDNRYHPPGDDK